MRTKTDGTIQTTLDFLRDIIATEMELPEDRVFIYDERAKLPTDKGLFVVLSYKGAPKVIANRNIPQTSVSDLSEDQEINMQEIIAIDVMSQNREALERKEEVLMAINSMYSQGIQEKNSFKIFRNPSIEDLSALEGAAMLKRYELSVVVFSWYSKVKLADYYEKFSAELNTEDETITIPLSS